MAATACAYMMNWATELFQKDEVAEVMAGLRDAHASPAEFVDAVSAYADPHTADLLREEFAELPPITITMMLEAWSMARQGGRELRMESVIPDEPFTFARNRRVRVSVEAEEDAVRVLLSHIPTRHAEWYAPAALSA